MRTVTDHIRATEALRTGPEGCRQRDLLFGILTIAIIQINQIPVPWLDGHISACREAIRALREGIPSE